MIKRRSAILFVLLLALLVTSVSAALLQEVDWDRTGDETVGLWNAAVVEESSMVVRAYYDDLSQVDQLMAYTEPWEVNQDKGFIVLGVTGNEYAILQTLGFSRIEVDQELTERYYGERTLDPDQQDGIPGFPCYRTVEETFQTAEDLAASYPNLAQVLDAGDSWEKTTPGGPDGYDMRVLVLTNQSTPGPKPKLFITSAIHAREYTTAELTTRFAEFLIQNYGSDPDATWLLDSHEVHLMLHANPDGRKLAENQILWRKNTNNNYCSNTNSRGADLNRNFDYKWGCCGGSSGSVCSDTYRGASAGSEPEVQAVQSYAQAIFPDQKGPNPTDPVPLDATGLFIDIHSYSELVLWPWGWTPTVPPNGTEMQTLGRKFAWYNGYYPEQSIGLYITDGTTDDFIFGELGVAAYTYELGTTFFQDCSTFENVIYPDNLPSLVYAAKVARTPYMTPAGPDALNVAVSSGVVNPGEVVDLTAVLNDTRFENANGTEPVQNVTAAEYYIDVPYWITSTVPVAYPMQPADGSFNAPVETATAQVDTTGWPGGRHMIYVRGQDADGNWGAVSAAFLYVISGNEGAFVGQLTDSVTAGPVQGYVIADSINFSTTTDASGVYTLTLPSGEWTLRAGGQYHLDTTVQNVTVSDGNLTQQDFVLDPTPGMLVETDTVVSAQALGQIVDQSLRITNPANLPLNFAITERNGGFQPTVQIVNARQEPLVQNFSVLLVDDDDNSPNVRSFYTDALDTLGIAYTVFDVGGGNGNGPSAAQMAAHDVVVWFSGDQFGSNEAGPNSYDEGQLTTYIQSGGKLFISSQDYHYDAGLTSFMINVLGVGGMTDDNGDYSSVTGLNAFDGYGPYTLNEPATDYSDRVTPGTGEAAFVGNNGYFAGVYTEDTVFFAFMWEGIANANAANGAEALEAVLDHLVPPEIPWLGEDPLSGTVPANSYIDVTLTFSATAPYVTQDGIYTGTLTLRGDDPANPRADIAIQMVVGDAANGAVQGTVQLQGRTDYSGIQLEALQGAVVVDSAVTNSSGGYSFSLPPGTYDIEIEMPGFLDAFKSAVSVTAGGSSSLGTLVLPAGDTNDDDIIDSIDVDFVIARYGQTCSDNDYDPLADLKLDCVINIQDLSIAGGNYGKSSPVPW